MNSIFGGSIPSFAVKTKLWKIERAILVGSTDPGFFNIFITAKYISNTDDMRSNTIIGIVTLNQYQMYYWSSQEVIWRIGHTTLLSLFLWQLVNRLPPINTIRNHLYQPLSGFQLIRSAHRFICRSSPSPMMNVWKVAKSTLTLLADSADHLTTPNQLQPILAILSKRRFPIILSDLHKILALELD